LLIKERLGHRIQSTMVYTSLVGWDQPDEWNVKRPSTIKEEDQLIGAGFEYLRFNDKLNMPIYRKSKLKTVKTLTLSPKREPLTSRSWAK
jgi:aminopeptidase-like protein